MSAESLGALLRRMKLTIAVAESCTGGKLGDLITDVSGSSDYFLGGVISYSNESKVSLLGVSSKTLRAKGAVSREVALQMADGVRKKLKADIGASTTGIAGPTGATKRKPVGLVYIAVCDAKFGIVERQVFKGSRYAVKTKAARRAIELLEGFAPSSE